MIHVDSGAIDVYLEQLWERKGTDLLLTVGVPPLLRIDGAMLQAEGAEVLDADRIEAMVIPATPPPVLEEFRAGEGRRLLVQLARAGPIPGQRVRPAGRDRAVLRLIPIEIPTFEELGLPPVIELRPCCPEGLVLVTGPTGSGKSTTLAAMID